MLLNLDWLIAPVDRARFVREYLEEKPLVISRECATYLEPLITPAQINELLAMAEYPTGYEVRMDSRGKPIASSEFHYIKNHGNLESRIGIRHERVADLFYRSGATIILDNLARGVSAVRDLSANLTREFNCQVSESLSIVPPAVHRAAAVETHDIFVCQLKGRKTWRIYEGPVRLPLGPQKVKNVSTDDLSPLLVVELREGDSLYIPRGFVHETDASAVISAHMTIAVFFTTYAKLIIDLVRVAGQNDFVFRKDFYADRLRSTASVNEVIDHLADHFSSNLTLSAMEEEFSKNKPTSHATWRVFE